jgi:hypothetical protein
VGGGFCKFVLAENRQIMAQNATKKIEKLVYLLKWLAKKPFYKRIMSIFLEFENYIFPTVGSVKRV